MSDISEITGHTKLTSQLKVSLESTQQPLQIQKEEELSGLTQFENDMELIEHAFTLVKEIRASLEKELRQDFN